jgi:glycosyltransferase involved in cell wall biosynthesis
MKELRYKILFLASWYPNRINKVLGVFIKRKAEAVARHCDVSVLYVTMDESLKGMKYEIESGYENGVYTVRVYFRPVMSGIIKKIFYNIWFIKGHYIGLKAIKKEWGSFDLVHVNVVSRAGFIALLLKKLRGIKYVITEHSTPDISFLKGDTTSTSIPLKFLRKIAVRNAEFINVDSKASHDYWKKAGIEGNYGIIRNIVEGLPQFFNYKKENNDDIKRAVHISILVERKNVADIIKAYAHIFYDLGRKNIEFHIVGTGEQKDMLEKLASDLKVLDQCVFFHGLVDENKKLELLVNSDFHILNSDEEGFSVVTAEAILYGIPVIATKCGGPEDFVPKETGILINRRNINELTEAIIFMLDHSGEYDKKVLQHFGKKMFSPEVIGDQTYEVYRKYITTWKAGNTGSKIMVLPDWKVLDLGSGHQPNRRANFLAERYMSETIHRTTQIVVRPADKYLIVADAHFLPFKDKSFDFVIASHIAEHVDDPEKFCLELTRVSKGGYLETPGPLTEFFMPTNSHKWVVSKKGDKLTFRPNHNIKPFSRTFFRIFYLNRDGYMKDPLITNNRLLKLMNLIIIKVWKYIPQTFTIIRWKDEIKAELITEE